MLDRLGVTFGMALLALTIAQPAASAVKGCRKLCRDAIKACAAHAKAANDCKGVKARTTARAGRPGATPSTSAEAARGRS